VDCLYETGIGMGLIAYVASNGSTSNTHLSGKETNTRSYRPAAFLSRFLDLSTSRRSLKLTSWALCMVRSW
jgi:hypothetical protein